MRKIAVVSFIDGLFCSRCPSAIGRLIVAVIVDTFNRMVFGWSLAHVCNKVFKTLPSGANRNPATAVVTKRFIFGVFTSLSHAAPTGIFRHLTKWLILNIAHGISLNNVVRSGADVYGIRPAHYTTVTA